LPAIRSMLLSPVKDIKNFLDSTPIFPTTAFYSEIRVLLHLSQSYQKIFCLPYIPAPYREAVGVGLKARKLIILFGSNYY